MKNLLKTAVIVLCLMVTSCTPNSITGNDTPTATDGNNEHVNPGRD